MNRNASGHQIAQESLEGTATPEWATRRAREAVHVRTHGQDRSTILAMLGLDREEDQ